MDDAQKKKMLDDLASDTWTPDLSGAMERVKKMTLPEFEAHCQKIADHYRPKDKQ